MKLDGIKDILSQYNLQMAQIRPNEFVIVAVQEQLKDICRELAGKVQLMAFFGNDERSIDGHYRLYLVFGMEEGVFLTLITALPSQDPSYESVTPVLPAAHWYEREIKDMFGIQPIGHPDPRRLVLHRGRPKGIYPLRKDYSSTNITAETVGVDTRNTEGHFPYQKVEGEGVIQVPVGPIHAGIIEPGHFRFHVVGETVLELEARLFYTHRGIEKLAEGKPWSQVTPLTERICGVCTVSHSISFANSVEKICDAELPARARYLRVVFAELERIYNHFNDISAICAGTGLALVTQKAAQIKEEFLRLNQSLTGHRYLQGVVVPGGVKKDLVTGQIAQITTLINKAGRELEELWESMVESDSFMDRAHTTGILTRDDALAFGAVGPAARASGLQADIRVDYPYEAYGRFKIEIPVGADGDVYDRLCIRVKELQVSFQLLHQVSFELLKNEGPVKIELPELLPPLAQAFGVTESARGSNFHWVMAGEDGKIYRYMVRSASYPNWPALAKTVPGNIIPDFPLINKSFELCYSCLDR